MTKSDASQRKLKFPKKNTDSVKYFYKCPHCHSVSFQYAPSGRRTLVCGSWRCNKRFWTYEGSITEDDWGIYWYGRNTDWRARHNAYLKRAREYMSKWFPDHRWEDDV